MSKTLQFDYTKFCLDGFKKIFPVLSESHPKRVAEWLYGTTSCFSGRDGRCLAGGGEDDIHYLVSVAADTELEISSARQIKDTLRKKVQNAWLKNDHFSIFYVARGFERTASLAVVDLRDVDWANPSRILEEDYEQDEIEIPDVIERWVETLCEPSSGRIVTGNTSRSREKRRPQNKVVQSLFEMESI